MFRTFDFSNEIMTPLWRLWCRVLDYNPLLSSTPPPHIVNGNPLMCQSFHSRSDLFAFFTRFSCQKINFYLHAAKTVLGINLNQEKLFSMHSWEMKSFQTIFVYMAESLAEYMCNNTQRCYLKYKYSITFVNVSLPQTKNY